MDGKSMKDKSVERFLVTVLMETADALANFLERILLSLVEDWWKEAVLDNLTFNQLQRVKQDGIDSLKSLDLAALLRVLDKNWYSISTKLDLPSKVPNFVKEMHEVRNRWAHPKPSGYPLDDLYRDLDTLERFVNLIGADKTLIEKIHTQRLSMSRLLHENTIPINEEKNEKEEKDINDKTDLKREFIANYDRRRVEHLCKLLIEERKAKTLGVEILAQLDQKFLAQPTYERLSRWVHPWRTQKFAQAIAAEISKILYGEEIERVQ
jgi:hypothetical protein